MTDTTEQAAHAKLVQAVMDLYEVQRILDAVAPVPQGASAVALNKVYAAAIESSKAFGEHEITGSAFRGGTPSSGDTTEQAARRIADEHPEPHRKYAVWRDGFVYTATPCYGIHEPLWVVMTMSGEVHPVPMRDEDRWVPLTTLVGESEPRAEMNGKDGAK